MKTQKTPVLIIILSIVFLLACLSSGSTPTNLPAEDLPSTDVLAPTTEQEIVETAIATNVIATATNTLVPTVCNASMWRIIPESILSFPSDNGFKYIVIPFVVKNDSPYWGQLHWSAMDAVAGNWTVTTDGGFIYKAGGEVETGEQSPYQIYGGPDVISTSLYNNLPDVSNDSSVYFPPGYVFRGGIVDFYVTAGFFPQMVFGIAETQNPITITIPSLTVWCIHDDGQTFNETIAPLYLNLNTDIQQVPKTDLPQLNHIDITAPIVIDGIGTLEYLGIKREDVDKTDCDQDNNCLITISYKFTNASSGYETSLGLDGLYLLGDDGLIRPQYGFVATVVGPGQTADVEVSFFSGPMTNKLMLIWHLTNPYRIIDLPTIQK